MYISDIAFKITAPAHYIQQGDSFLTRVGVKKLHCHLQFINLYRNFQSLNKYLRECTNVFKNSNLSQTWHALGFKQL